MLKNLWLRVKFLNIWNWAQLSVMLLTLVCFVVLTLVSITFVVERQAKAEMQSKFNSFQNYMQENTKLLLEGADYIARMVETGDRQKIENIVEAYSIDLVGEKEIKFDMLLVIDKKHNKIYCDHGCNSTYITYDLPVMQKAFNGTKVASVERFSEVLLRDERLDKQAEITLKDNPGKKLKDGLVRVAAVPYYKNGVQDGIVLVGLLVNNNTRAVDWYSSNQHGAMSIYLDGYCISTSMMDVSNKRSTGTRLPEEVYRSLYVEGKPFEGKIRLDKTSYAKYDFLYNAFQEPVGVVGITEDYERFVAIFKNGIIFIWIIALVLGLIMIYSLRRLNGMVMLPIREVTNGAIRLARNDLAYRIPVEHTIKCWKILNCGKKDCQMYGRAELACWLAEHTLCTGESLPFETKLKHCQKCPVYLTYSRNETKQLVATFNYMARVIQQQTKQLKDRQRELYGLIDDLEDYESVVLTLALAVEAKDYYTLGHSERVSEYALSLGEKLSLSLEQLETLRIGTILHDIGKIAISDEILRKSSALTDDEFDLIKQHPERGAAICANLKFAIKSLPIILHHHERFDGSGYPKGLKGHEIPYLARITTIADSFDAMTSDRPYRSGMNMEQAIQELKNNTGTQFDPEITAVFIKLLENKEITILKNKYQGA